MKKVLFSLLLVTLTSVSLSQTLRINAGLSFSKLDWEILGTKFFPNQSIQPTGGIGIEYLQKGVFSLSSNIEYLCKAGKGEEAMLNENGTDIGMQKVTAEYRYILLNTFAKIKAPLKGKTKPFINAGFYGGYLVSVSKNLDKDFVKKFNYGAIAGIGVLHKFDHSEIGIEGNLMPSFNKLSSEDNLTVKDKTFNIKVYYAFPLQ